VVSWPLYRVLVGAALLPPLIALLTLRQPAIPQHPLPPLEFDGKAAATAAASFVAAEHTNNQECCAPGSGGELAGADWVARKLKVLDSGPSQVAFAARVPGESSPVAMSNVIAYRPGRSPQIIAVVAHRDGSTAGDAAGTGMLIQLARTFVDMPRDRGLVLVSTDGGRTGAQGAAAFGRTWGLRSRIVAAIVIDRVAAPDGTPLRIVVRPDTPQGTSPTVYSTARDGLEAFYHAPALTPGLFDQLSGYAVPYTTREQGPLIARDIPAVTLTAGAAGDHLQLNDLDAAQLGRAGAATANIVAELNSAATIERGGEPALFLSGKVMRGWLAEVTVAMLLVPYVVCVLDVVARLRRRRVPIAPGIRALGWRFAAWFTVLVALWIEALAPGGLMPKFDSAPLRGQTGATTAGMLLAAGAGLLVWRFGGRPRLVREGGVTGSDRTGGLAGALVGLLFAAVLLTAVDPFTLIILLPAVHLWLWIPAASRLGRRGMLACYAAGFVGVIALVWELAGPQGLGSDAPRALVAMIAGGYLSPLVAVCMCLAAASASQIGALVLGRYGPPHPPV
jgi:peptidase M28-like protein